MSFLPAGVLARWRRSGVVPEQIRRVGLRTMMLSATYMVIVLVGLVSLTLPHQTGWEFPAVLTLCAAGIFIGVGLWVARLRASITLCEALVAANSAMVACGIASLGHASALAGGLQAVYGNTYLWLAVYSLVFFRRRHALVQIGFGAACYLTGILAAGRGASGAGQVAVHTVSSLAIVFTIERVLGVARRLASNDALTGTPNREVLRLHATRALAQARRTGTAIGLLLIDLDDFKAINDTRGHEVGDDVLRGVATSLRSAFGAANQVVRLGGDEFVVMLTALGPTDDGSSAVARARSALAAAAPASARDLVIRGSVGLAIGPACPDDDFSTMLRRADEAMYADKRHRGRAATGRRPRDRVA